MKRLYSRKAMIPVLLVVLGVLAVTSSPLGFTPLAFVIMAGIAVPAVLFLLWREPQTVAEVLHTVDTPPRTDR
jgi:hypothetical protein